MSKPREQPLATAAVRPGPRLRMLMNLTGAGLWISGSLWLLFHYVFRRETEWGLEPHMLEPWWLALHGAFAFLALWTLGLVFGAHVIGAWATARRRWTGLVLAAWLMALTVTGCFLLYAADDGVLGLISPAHWIAGLALPFAFAAHRWLRRD